LPTKASPGRIARQDHRRLIALTAAWRVGLISQDLADACEVGVAHPKPFGALKEGRRHGGKIGFGAQTFRHDAAKLDVLHRHPETRPKARLLPAMSRPVFAKNGLSAMPPMPLTTS